jgi:hypothetical protein
VLEAWFFIAAALLVLSGGSKLVDPAPTRGALAASRLPSGVWAPLALGAVEIAAGITGVVVGSWAAGLVGAVYLGFAAFVVHALWRRLPIQSCGCFGKVDTPPTWAHVAFDLVSGGVAITVAFGGVPPLATLEGQPLVGLPYLGFVGLGVAVVYLLLAELPRLRAASR